MKELKENPVFKKIWSKFGYNLFVFLGLAGVLLLGAGDIFSRKTENTENTGSAGFQNAEEYRQSLEKNLSEIISSIDGAGRVKIMITLESGEENVFEQQEKTTDDEKTVSGRTSDENTRRSTYENRVVLVNDGADRQALVKKILRPPVQGVAVVCRGADDVQVVSDITNAVSVVLDIPTSRICVIKMK